MADERVVDLRSDTVTKPTPEMRQAMFDSAVGDDVYGDDPTVNKLEALAAEIFGKEAALFVPSGHMGNLISVMVHCSERGSEFICGDLCHIYYYEQGSSASLAGAHPRALPTQPDGSLALSDIAHAIRSDDVHFPRTRMVALETTHNKKGGVALPVEYIDAVGEMAAAHGMKLHIDGARIMNAATALGVSPARMVRAADSLTCCLSKGLGSPVGSVLMGTAHFIYHARRARKALGGGMRQAGVLAACGLLSLTTMVDRLSDDHANATALAEAFDAIDGLSVDLGRTQTNLVMLEIEREGLTDAAAVAAPAATFLAAMKARGVWMGDPKSETRMRACLHHMISADDVQRAARTAAEVMALLRQQ